MFVVSKQAGKISYYQPTDQVADIEKTKTLNKLARQVSKVDGELTAITEEINLAMAEKKKETNKGFKTSLENAQMGSLSQWLESYGRPDGDIEKNKDQYVNLGICRGYVHMFICLEGYYSVIL